MFSEALRFEHQYLLYVSLPMELCKSESNKDDEFEFEFEFNLKPLAVLRRGSDPRN